MAKPRTLSFGKFKIYVEDPDNPGQYIAPCGFTDKSLTLSASTSSEDIPDCDDPDAPAWVARNVKSLSAAVAGSGVLALESFKTWRDYFLAGLSFPVRVMFDDTGANGGGYFSGSAVMTNFQQSGSLGDRTKASVALDSDGEWAWTDAA